MNEPFYVGSTRLERAERRWIIQAEPQVIRKLKRWFEGIPKDTPGDSAPVVDSPVNCKDLLWFMGNMPLRISPADLAYLTERADVETKRLAAVKSVLLGNYTPTKFKVALEPWPFQYLPAELTLAAGGLLCADEVGLGKTLEGAILLSDPRALPALVVCPKQIVAQWEKRLHQYLPGIKTHVLRKVTPYPLDLGPRGKKTEMPDVLICTYAKLAGWVGTLADYINTVIYDEAHNLCHEWADNKKEKRILKYEAALYLRDRVRYRLALSGTPIMNYGGETRVVMGILLNDSLGTEKEFGHAYCNGATGEKAVLEDPRALGAQMMSQGLMVCRSREDVGRYLPPVTVHIQPVECDMVLLNKVKIETLAFAETLLRRGGDPEEKRHAAGQIDWKLRHATGLAKAPAVIELTKIIAARTPVLLLAWHHDFYAEMAKGLREFKPVFFHGRMTDLQKAAAVEAFVSGKTNIIIMSHRAAEGLDDLQKVCSTIIIGELDWTYSRMMKQNVGRLQREGQKNPVFVHVAIGDAGADPIMAEVLKIKREQLEGLIRPDAPMLEEVQTDPAHVKELARAWMQMQDPRALARIEKDIKDAEIAKLGEKAAKAAEREAKRASRKGARAGAPSLTLVPPPIPVPTFQRPPLEEHDVNLREALDRIEAQPEPAPAPRVQLITSRPVQIVPAPLPPSFSPASPAPPSPATPSRTTPRTRQRIRAWQNG